MLLGVGGDLDTNSVVIFDFISDGRNRDRTFGDLIDDLLVDVVVGEDVDEVGLDFSSVNTLGGWFMGFGLNYYKNPNDNLPWNQWNTQLQIAKVPLFMHNYKLILKNDSIK